MNYVTSEIKYNKELKKVLKRTISFSRKTFSKKIKGSNKYTDNSIIGNSYELLFQIEYLKKENRIFEFYNLKYARAKKILTDNVSSEKSDKILTNVFKHEKNIIMYMQGKKVKSLYKSILYLTELNNIREHIDYKSFNTISDKYEEKELKKLHKNLNKKIFKKLKGVEFNKVIQSGYLVGEIDLLTNNMITDIKTTAFCEITKEMIYQQILYKLIVETSTDQKIKYISIYLSKFNMLKTYKVNKLIKKEKELKKYLQKRYRLNSF